MKLLVLDGNSILNRAFYGIKLLSTKAGEFTNGIYGFLTMFKKLCDETEPDAVAVAFDRKAPTFRHKAYAGYKANRKGMPPELAQQLPVLQELLTLMGYRIVSCEGWEADDILGTLAAACEQRGDACVIATGDRDSLQLVSGGTTVRLATTKFGQPQVTVYDEAKIKEEYGVTPAPDDRPEGHSGRRFRLYSRRGGHRPQGRGGADSEIRQRLLSLRSPGRAGTEARCAGQAGKVQGERAAELRPGHHPQGRPHRYRGAPLCKGGGRAAEGLRPYGAAGAVFPAGKIRTFRNGSSRAGGAPASERPQVRDCPDGAPVLARLEDAGRLTSMGTGTRTDASQPRLLPRGELFRVTPDDAFLRAFFRSREVKKYTHDVKPLHRKALALGCKVENVAMDTALAGYLLNPSASGYDVKRLAAEYGVSQTDFEEAELNAGAAMPDLCRALSRAIDENEQRELLQNIEIPLAYVLAQMEHVGFYVDKGSIEAYGRELEQQEQALHDSIIEQVGFSFNINSPSSWARRSLTSWACPTGKKRRAAGPPMQTCWKSCGISIP